MAAAAAKSLQSCPTLCDPRVGSPPGSPVPGILQVRTLEWVVISFSGVANTTKLVSGPLFSLFSRLVSLDVQLHYFNLIIYIYIYIYIKCSIKIVSNFFTPIWSPLLKEMFFDMGNCLSFGGHSSLICIEIAEVSLKSLKTFQF